MPRISPLTRCWPWLLLALSLMLTPLAAEEATPDAATEEPTIIILVRHAEKTAPTGDPDLSPSGRERAQALAHALFDVGIDAVYATPYKRTQQTAAPVAEALGLEVHIAEVRPSYGEPLARQIHEQHSGETVLAVSHSNTVPELLAALGIDPAPQIADHQYDQLFIVTLPPDRPPRLLTLHYGVPTPK